MCKGREQLDEGGAHQPTDAADAYDGGDTGDDEHS